MAVFRVQLPVSPTQRPVEYKLVRRSDTAEEVERYHPGRSPDSIWLGDVVKQDHTTLAASSFGCDSRRLQRSSPLAQQQCARL